MCGRITGYQFYTTDAFGPYINYGESINGNFVDGITLTHGSPRTHIWTFACGLSQYETNPSGCPCNNDLFTYSLPPFVGTDYFCDSGHRYNVDPPSDYLTNDPLWDGAGCVSGSCCTFNSPPWFCKTLPHPTTDDIELRQCLRMYLLKKLNFMFSELNSLEEVTNYDYNCMSQNLCFCEWYAIHMIFHVKLVKAQLFN